MKIEIYPNSILSVPTSNSKKINRFTVQYQLIDINGKTITKASPSLKEYKSQINREANILISNIIKEAKNPSKTPKEFSNLARKLIEKKLYSTKLYNSNCSNRKEKLLSVTFDPVLAKSSIKLTLKPGFKQLYRAFKADYPALSLSSAKSRGRLNRIGKPVFYLSMSQNTVKAEIPDYKIIHQYEVINPIKLRLSFVSLYSSSIFDTESTEIGELLISVFNKLLTLKDDNYDTMQNYYELTNDILENYIINYNDINGIAYPSVKTSNHEKPIEKKDQQLQLNLDTINLILLNGEKPEKYLRDIRKIKRN